MFESIYLSILIAGFGFCGWIRRRRLPGEYLQNHH